MSSSTYLPTRWYGSTSETERGPASKRHSASKASAHKHPAPNQLVVKVDRSASKEERVEVLVRGRTAGRVAGLTHSLSVCLG